MLRNVSRPSVPAVVYLDAEPGNRAAFQEAFRLDFHVLPAADLAQALAFMAAQEVQVVVGSQHMPGMAGHEALRTIRERFPQVRRMLISAHADLQALVDALNEAAVCRYIEKPWETEAVRTAVLRACEEYRKEKERNDFTAQLLESNRQLEFALRQSLLS